MNVIYFEWDLVQRGVFLWAGGGLSVLPCGGSKTTVITGRYCIVMWVSIYPWDVSLGGLGAGRIARRDCLSTPGAGLMS